MYKSIFHIILMSVIACVLIACGASTKPIPSEPNKPIAVVTDPSKPMECRDPRPEMCTQQYVPVCATKLEAPVCKPGMVCPAVMIVKKKTYSNSCMACSDVKVSSYTDGACS